MISSGLYTQMGRTYVADLHLEVERARIARAARDTRGARRLKSLPGLRGAFTARRFRPLARLRTA